MSDPTDTKNIAAGVAALAICESLLLALSDLKIISTKDAAGVLEDAAAVHRGAATATPAAELQREAAAAIDRIIASGSQALRP